MILARVFVLCWFLAALTLSVTGWFERFYAGTLFAVGALAAATAFTVLHRISERFRGFVRARSLKRFTLGQTLRFYGLLALVKTYQGVLPPVFALPTAIIDVAFAVTSFFVASRLLSASGQPKPGFFVWHVLGLVGLGVSVALAILTSSNEWGLTFGGPTSQAMTRFPISLVPTFVGPLMVTLHLLAISQGWAVESDRGRSRAV
jgi:hypothetical protein